MDAVYQRFINKVTLREDGCWDWSGSQKAGIGYSQFYFKRSNGKWCARAHIYSYLHYVGDIPEGLVLDHICRNRFCVNPKHLRAVTQRENILSGRGRSAINARKTKCSHGHDFTEENTYRAKVYINGKLSIRRSCKKCSIERTKIWKLAHKSKSEKVRGL